MPNPYFNNAIDLLPVTRARAADVEANFSAVGAGFDAVKTDMDAKAPLASPTFTGMPSAPTPPSGDASTRLATMAALKAAIDSAAAINLPDVSGAEGKYLRVISGVPAWSDMHLLNVVHNGNFSVNQRGVFGSVSLAANAYGHDRWKAGTGGCVYSFSVSEGITTITISSGTLVQVVEGADIRTATYVASWGGTAQGRINGGAYGSSGITASLVGGVNATIEFGVGTLSLVQLERGAQATTTILRPHLIEETICQRYLPSTSVSHVLGQSYNVNVAYYHAPFNVDARAAPTGILLTGSLSNYLVTNSSFAYTAMTGGVVAFGTSAIGGGSFTAAPTSAVWAAGGEATSMRLSAGSRILWTGAEL